MRKSVSGMNSKLLPGKPRFFAVAAATALLLVACGEDPAQPAGSAGTTRPAQTKATADETRGMVSGVTDEKKKGAPVDLKFEIRSRPLLNEALPIDIAFIPRQGSDLLRATFLATEGLSVTTSPEPAEYKDVQAQGVYRHTLTVVPKQEGVFYVTAIVVMNTSSGAAEARTFQIPLLIGAPADATEATKAPEDPGQPAAPAPAPTATDSN
jgi:hypothetical protein